MENRFAVAKSIEQVSEEGASVCGGGKEFDNSLPPNTVLFVELSFETLYGSFMVHSLTPGLGESKAY